jgi:hypothetical protein
MRFPTAIAALVVLLAALAPSAAAAPTATASKSCRVGDTRSYGTSYVTSISVSNTSCRAGRSLVRAFHACRPGKSGRCPRVKGYSCSEQRTTGRSQYLSKVTCRNGSKTDKHSYSQFT